MWQGLFWFGVVGLGFFLDRGYNMQLHILYLSKLLQSGCMPSFKAVSKLFRILYLSYCY